MSTKYTDKLIFLLRTSDHVKQVPHTSSDGIWSLNSSILLSVSCTIPSATFTASTVSCTAQCSTSSHWQHILNQFATSLYSVPDSFKSALKAQLFTDCTFIVFGAVTIVRYCFVQHPCIGLCMLWHQRMSRVE